MNRRLPIVVLVLGTLVAALLVDRAVDDTSPVETADAIDASVFPIASPGARSSTWYCAGGTADEEGFADHTVLLLNPTDQEATVTVTVHAGELAPPSLVVDPDDLDEDDGGEEPADDESDDDSDGGSTTTSAASSDLPGPQVQTVTVAAQSREQIVLSEVVTAPVASALVESSLGGLVVEHEVRSIHGYDAKPCATAAAPEWHFAWGDTSVDSRELLVLFNPFPRDAIVDGRFSADDGIREPVRFDGLVVPARGTIGVDLGDDVTRRDQVSGTITTRSGQIVVDRVLRIDGDDGRGLTVQTGVPQPQQSWVFPDGYRSDEVREEYVVYNPGDEVAEAEIEFVVDDPETNGIPAPIDLSLAPGTHQVVDVASDERVPAEVGHSAVVRSLNGVPVVAERVVYSDRTNRRGITVTTGSPVESESWTFAAGAAGADHDEFLVLVNLDQQVLSEIRVVAIAGGQRLPIAGLDGIELAPGERRVISLDENTESTELPLEVQATEPIVVERGLYQVGDEARGMSNAVGVPGPQGLRPPPDPLEAVPEDVDVGDPDANPDGDGDDTPQAPEDVELPEPDETIVIEDPDAEADTEPDATTTTEPSSESPPDDEVPETTP